MWEKIKGWWHTAADWASAAYVGVMFVADYIGDWIAAYPKTSLVAMIVLAVL